MPVAAPPLQDRYQPMSFLAVAALCFGLVAPLVFLIDQPWYCFWVVLPGIFLAVLARRQVLRSDGAVAGYIPATLAAILTVGSGVGWLTKAVVVQAIVDHESSRFLDDWLSKLKQGQIGSAFLDTQRPDLRRVSFAVEDERNLRLHFPGRKDDSFNAYDNFRHNALVNLLQRYGDRAELRYLGKADHGLTAGGEQRFVKHEFELVTPMGRHKVVIRVESDFESILSGRRRGWVIAIRGREVEGVVELLPYGRNLADAVTSSQDRVQKWISLMSAGDRQRFTAEIADANRRAGAGQIYDSLRADIPEQQSVGIGVVLPMLLLADEPKGTTGWRLRFSTLLESQTREIDCTIVMETDNLADGPGGWRLIDCTFDGERRRQDSSGGRGAISMPPAPPVPDR